jgi:choline/glycine/proline betaine transport protein
VTVMSDDNAQEPDDQQDSHEATDEETEYLTELLPTSTRFEIRLQVFIPASLIILAFVISGVFFTDEMASLFEATQEFVAGNLGWFYILPINIFLVFVIWLALGRFGGIKLGPDDAEPDFSYFSWFAMLFSAGIGIGFLFFGVAEPISHFAVDPPPTITDPGSEQAAREAINATFLHWGFHAWAIYIVMALTLCYFAYRRGLPLALRSAFYPILGKRIRGWIGDAIDTLAIFGTLFGVSISLALGSTQINSGLNMLAGISPSLTVQLLLIAGITAVAVGSVLLGVHRGIRRLSLMNIIVFTALLIFVLVAGPTVYLLNSFLENIGFYLRNLPETGLRTDALADPTWQGNWTLFYWGWWVSWSPFVGMFIARISRGRTIREFISGVLLVPVLVSFLIFTVFGNTAMFFELTGRTGIVAATEETFEFAFFAMLEFLPLATVTSIVALVIIATFFITSSDSGSLVDDIHASGGSIRPHKVTRIYWAVAEGVVAGVLLIAAGVAELTAFQLVAMATGLPLIILMLFMCYALWLALRKDCAIQEMVEHERLLEETRRAAIHELHQQSWPITAGPWRIRGERQTVDSQAKGD